MATKKAKVAAAGIKRILVSGGAGYIGSHTVLELLGSGFEVVVVDSLVNSSAEALKRVAQLAQVKEIVFRKVDICDFKAIQAVFEEFKFDACIHFAGLKAVGESVAQPVRYYENNLGSTLNLLKLMDQYECRNLVFSSSATVYGEPKQDPSKITEDYELSATNPYGRTKLFIEEILRDVAISAPGMWKICLLRYFNPVGAHPSGLIGEDPNGIPNNLVPYILQVAVGRRECLNVFGSDYDTPDGTGVRDYIHVCDLATGHVAALQEAVFGDGMDQDCDAFNLGTGHGTSVLEMLAAVSKACGKKLKFKLGPRRPGDVAVCCGNADKAELKLKWKATRTMEQAAADGWRWQEKNPNGFGK